MKKIKTNNKLDVVFLLDRSGSMHNSVLDTIGGYNSYLDKQRDKNAKITTVLFDDKIEYLYFRKDVKEIDNLTEKDYFVRGCTALYDAIGTTICKLEKEKIRSKVLFIITTDGLENSSCEYNKKKISSLIKKHNNWEFIFLGANIDSFEEGGSIGIKKDRIANYEQSSDGISKMFCKLASISEDMYEDKDFDLDL